MNQIMEENFEKRRFPAFASVEGRGQEKFSGAAPQTPPLLPPWVRRFELYQISYKIE